MKNIEKYTNTKDALEAYDSLASKTVSFYTWLECEFEEPRVPTLLEAAEAVLSTWRANGHEGSLAAVALKIGALAQAVEDEKRKPIRNFNKYKTPEEAYDAFMKFCEKTDCPDCVAAKIEIKDCPLAWVYAEAEKEEAK